MRSVMIGGGDDSSKSRSSAFFSPVADQQVSGAATARANANVALAKYWGKRDDRLNLPYTGSISVTLAGLTSSAAVRFAGERGADDVRIEGTRAPDAAAARVTEFLDLVRTVAGTDARAEVRISSNFPIAAGLASSASMYAALALAATCAAGVTVSRRECSILARRGSGSAARSLFGGYVEWLAGEASDGSDSYAVPLAPAEHWDLGVVIAITDLTPKPVGSREGMARALKQSPFFPAWLASHDGDLEQVRHAIQRRDLTLLGRVAEHNCLKMHAASMAARPALLYWRPATLAIMQLVWELRGAGLEAYFTIDAGPQVKVLCAMADRTAVAAAIERLPGVQQVILSRPGSGAELVTAND